MRKLTISKVKKELLQNNADPATTEVVLSLVEHHNDLVTEYNNGEKHQQYLCYQLKQQYFKMLQDLRKQSMKSGKLEDTEDNFKQMVDAIKESKMKPVKGFQNNLKDEDVETR